LLTARPDTDAPRKERLAVFVQTTKFKDVGFLKEEPSLLWKENIKPR
jgi:hypothetical protein